MIAGVANGDTEMPCLGTSHEFLLQMSAGGYSNTRKQQIQDGFSHVIGEACSTKATEASNKKWDFYGNLHGILRNKKDKDSVSFYMTETDPFGAMQTRVV